MQKLNNTILNNIWIKEEIPREIKNALRWVKMKAQHSKTYGIELKQSSMYREIYSFIKKGKKSQISDITFTLGN